MRITITQEFDSVEAAAVFLARVGNPAHVVERLTADPVPETVAERTAVIADAVRARKPRADAGKKREPYGPRATEAAAPETAGASQREGTGTTAGAANFAPAVPTPVAGSDGPAQDAASAAAAPTLADARAEMKKLFDAPGKGMEACHQALKKHGVVRISDLKPELYGALIKDVQAELSVPK